MPTQVKGVRKKPPTKRLQTGVAVIAGPASRGGRVTIMSWGSTVNLFWQLEKRGATS
jgi:hypothetical protein